MAKITERHKIVRKLLKIMSKEELAATMKNSVDTIRRWSKGERTPSFADYYLLKKIYKKQQEEVKKGEQDE